MRHKRPLKITSRTSSVTNGFVQAILPDIPPTEQDRAAALAALGLPPHQCVYCGDQATDWDHLRPIVINKRPSGYLTDYRNLVPACGPCNQSKSGQNWKSWMTGKATRSPASRNIIDLQARIARLEAYERWGDVDEVDFATLVGKDRWEAYWAKLVIIEGLMRQAQAEADAIRALISTKLHRES
ncbi:HNH endonuclease [Sphingobium sp. TCM1]|uniref:HNH endonuclease n=1 Tax=Sphingobium sp. TCM1 TaxID=453246 RepID=UPI000A894675|nr:HNH endonuclease [Sphingobium sp. TCM1]